MLHQDMLHRESIGNDTQPEITITKSNLGRLDVMLANHAPIRSWRAVEHLLQELKRAAVVTDDETPADVVTMHSRVEFFDGDSPMARVATLVYPGESAIYEDALSVVTPVGVALLGLSAGQSMSYPGPDGRSRTIRVARILYQPEATKRIRA